MPNTTQQHSYKQQLSDATSLIEKQGTPGVRLPPNM